MGPPRLDHVSLLSAPATLAELGFHLTPTVGSKAHSRIFLDRHYLEIDETNATRVGATGWFLGVADLDRTALALSAEEIPALWPAQSRYHDGLWKNLIIVGQTPSIPVLTHRMDLSGDVWPPHLEQPHPNGATSISELRLRTNEPTLLTTYLTTIEAIPLSPNRFELSESVVVVIEDAAGGIEGIAAIAIHCGDGPPLSIECRTETDDLRMTASDQESAGSSSNAPP